MNESCLRMPMTEKNLKRIRLKTDRGRDGGGSLTERLLNVTGWSVTDSVKEGCYMPSNANDRTNPKRIRTISKREQDGKMSHTCEWQCTERTAGRSISPNAINETNLKTIRSNKVSDGKKLSWKSDKGWHSDMVKWHSNRERRGEKTRRRDTSCHRMSFTEGNLTQYDGSMTENEDGWRRNAAECH